MSTAAPSLKLGDVVVLKSGSARMTIVRFPLGTDLAEVAWWRTEDSVLALARIPVACLAPAAPVHGVYLIH